jgi:hypothetical protein
MGCMGKGFSFAVVHVERPCQGRVWDDLLRAWGRGLEQRQQLATCCSNSTVIPAQHRRKRMELTTEGRSLDASRGNSSTHLRAGEQAPTDALALRRYSV